jgi:hypothetical protein
MEPGGQARRSMHRAHPSGSGAWRRWRMLPTAVFNGGEAAPVTDDIDGVAL